jgi:septal ring factor EnvC (AmiA/AmiB activator)
VDDERWRTGYTKLLKQIRGMQRDLTRVQEEARAVRDRVASEREKLRSVRLERRASGRFTKVTELDDVAAHRKRRRKR